MDKMKMLFPHILTILLSLNMLAQEKAINHSKDYRNLEGYELINIKTEYLPKHKFPNPTFDEGLNFLPSNNNKYYNEYVSFKGKVKKVTEFIKKPSDREKRFYSSTLYDINGNITATIGYYNTETFYYYDSNDNLIRKNHFFNSDTLHITKFGYNKKNQLVKMEKKYFSEDSKKYDFEVTIEYDKKSSPISIRRNNIHENELTTEYIYYDGNKVTIMDEDHQVTKVHFYSANNNLVKKEFGYHTLFFFYDEKNRVIEETTYRNQKYCCARFFSFNDHGDIVGHSFTKLNSNETHNFDLKYDSSHNMIYKYKSNNFSDTTSERFYEIEYYQ